jgi:hypothetical protein
VRSAAGAPRRATVAVPGAGRLTVEVFDATGRLVDRSRISSTRTKSGRALSVRVLPGGFTLARR